MIYADRNNLTSGWPSVLDSNTMFHYVPRMAVRRPKPKKNHLLDVPRFMLYPGDEALAQWLRDEADREDRTLTAQIRNLLRRCYKESAAE